MKRFSRVVYDSLGRASLVRDQLPIRMRGGWVMRYRDKRCPYCGTQFSMSPGYEFYPSRDHLWPRSRFPHKKRIVICCMRCNSQKTNYTIMEWFLLLRSRNDARAPHVMKFMENDKEWEEFARGVPS